MISRLYLPYISAKEVLETPQRIEPARLEEIPEAISDLLAELSAISARLETALHPATAASLAAMVRIMNTYYSNLIEGHVTRPRDIERAIAFAPFVTDVPQTVDIEKALAGSLDQGRQARSLLVEAVAHVRVQEGIDRSFAAGDVMEPASADFILHVHREFYRGASQDMLRVQGPDGTFTMEPGCFRTLPSQDVSVGRHVPPSSDRVADYMAYFEKRYEFAKLGRVARILAIPAAHHRFNYIHPFADGNGRVSRLMSHAMACAAGVGSHGLWSISRGLARGLGSRSDYKLHMDHADMPRQGDLDGRGNLSQRALIEFTEWFLKVCIDQISFMADLFQIGTLSRRLRSYVERSQSLRPEAARLLEEALGRGEVDRGELPRITGLPERSARRLLSAVIAEGLLGSATPKGPVSLRFPAAAQDVLFPRLFAEP